MSELNEHRESTVWALYAWALKYAVDSSDNEVKVRFICSFQFFMKFRKVNVLFYIFDNERVVVIKQSIMVLPVEKP